MGSGNELNQMLEYEHITQSAAPHLQMEIMPINTKVIQILLQLLALGEILLKYNSHY
jgi:hypothetical protein